jgi:hypothetical protein
MQRSTAVLLKLDFTIKHLLMSALVVNRRFNEKKYLYAKIPKA